MNNIILNNTDKLLTFTKKKRFNKILIITGKKSFKLSGAKSFFNNFVKNTNCFFFFKSKKLPEYSELKKILETIKQVKPNLIISIGGGSVLDYSKIASCVKKIEFKKKKFNYIFRKSKIFLISIPTTAGSGAEVTEGCVLYYGNTKFSLEDKKFIPSKFFLVPKIIEKCSFKLKATCGWDTLCQSMESMVSLKSNSKSRRYAKHSIRLFNKSFLKYLYKPNIQNSKTMSISSNYSGKAINLTKTTIPHALSYPITTIYGFDHGHAVATTLEEVFAISFLKAKKNIKIKKKYLELFKVMKINNYDEFKKKINFLKKKTKLNFSLLKKLNNKKVNQIMSSINIQRLKNNPVPLSFDEIRKHVFKK